MAHVRSTTYPAHKNVTVYPQCPFARREANFVCGDVLCGPGGTLCSVLQINDECPHDNLSKQQENK